MKKFYKLEPEVAGTLGLNTEMDTSTHPPVVSKLHYDMDIWLGDDLLETFPCYLVTDKLRRVIEEMGATGAAFDEVEVVFTEEFDERHPVHTRPVLSWLKPVGLPGEDDIAIVPPSRLIVSERMWEAMKARTSVNHCDVEDYEG